ncbi:ATP-binding cassette domain-containing protein [Listeria weihenstephanensis]|uniref:ATP-binding cassette domain-containing protein n=1 Tax=Listeria weihenstephanensis TaxID=1006155 RepID=A0A841Z1H9_9LIST|nr:ATP-binding cassette domain-containing protein [Listeria weihenstephanensis]MBC1499110.1 ATP-binding cassette domain-containing protein [Listeria weihenstephanensis]
MNNTKAFSIFSIKKPGIYLITGSNGGGKTTFIERELKNKQSRQKDIAYFAQKNWKYKTTVRQFLAFPEINPHLVKQYCELFSIDAHYLDKDIRALSGGEFVKVELVRTLSLDTAMIILDELTNNLDNGSTEILSNVLSELSKTKIIFLVSHDKRLEHFSEKTILIENGQIEVSSAIELEETRLEMLTKKFVLNRKIFSYLLKSKFNILMLSFILVLTSLLTIIVSNTILYTVPMDAELESDYYFEMLDIGENYSRYFDTVMTSSEAEEKFQNLNYLSIDELRELNNKEYINQIYVVDQAYINELTLDNSKLDLLALPEIVTSSPNYETSFPLSKKMLIKGRFPEDNEKEIALSFAQLEKFFDYNSNEESVIGEQIEINGVLHEIVGIVSSPVAAISYSNQMQRYGVAEVADKNVAQLTKMLATLKEQGYEDPYFAKIFIETNTKKSLELLDYLEVHGPSYQYASNYVDQAVQLSFYKEKLTSIIPISVILSVIISALILAFGQRSFNLVSGFLNDMANLNFKPRKNKRLLYFIMMIDYMISVPICLAWNQLIIGSTAGFIMMLPTMGISLVMFIVTLFLMNYRDKKNDSRNL